MKRTETRQFFIKNTLIGGQNKVLIQSMCNIKTSNVEEVIKQILELESIGCDIIRCSIMDEDDAKMAFMRHATSKLKNLDDLFNIESLGFRGEALATISAVSKVTMITKTNDEDVGICVKLDGGEQIDSYEVASVTGTKIEVSNLFFNTPARLKFLRKPSGDQLIILF